ncbi:MAG: carbohydrate kinase [Bacteroidetes bacterium]|nr:MAG: carbohydrate kinase [Bacteroidota bacterium]
MPFVICFGEVLWDVFPTHKEIGGAPLNVALRLRSLGNDASIISSVGDDIDGKKLISYITSNAINANEIQISKKFQTGQVKVVLDKKGSATYNIKFPCAWDSIHLNEELKEFVKKSDAFVFGSLVARNKVSKHTLLELLKVAKYKIFDVNLRPPHYTLDVLTKLMGEANFIKFNDDELLEICEQLDFYSSDIESNIKFISNTTKTGNICVTLGKDGAILFVSNIFFKNYGYSIQVKDTVGAGDSFLASLISELLNNKPPQEALDFACAVGAIVASSNGANPKIAEKDIAQLIKR